MLSVSSIFILAVDPELQKYLLLKYQEVSEIWQSVLAKKIIFCFFLKILSDIVSPKDSDTVSEILKDTAV